MVAEKRRKAHVKYTATVEFDGVTTTTAKESLDELSLSKPRPLMYHLKHDARVTSLFNHNN